MSNAQWANNGGANENPDTTRFFTNSLRLLVLTLLTTLPAHAEEADGRILLRGDDVPDTTMYQTLVHTIHRNGYAKAVNIVQFTIGMSNSDAHLLVEFMLAEKDRMADERATTRREMLCTPEVFANSETAFRTLRVLDDLRDNMRQRSSILARSVISSESAEKLDQYLKRKSGVVVVKITNYEQDYEKRRVDVRNYTEEWCNKGGDG